MVSFEVQVEGHVLPDQVGILGISQTIPEVPNRLDGGAEVIARGVQRETDGCPPPAHQRRQIVQVRHIRYGADCDRGVAINLAVFGGGKVLNDPELTLLVQATR